jgi:hypothetical protein
MQKKESEITDQEIDTIVNKDLDVNFWIFQLGISVSDESAFDDNRFSFPFLDAGKKFWNDSKDKIRELLCDTSKNEPKEFVSDILRDDVREVVLFCAKQIINHFEFTADVTIPIVALIIKEGLINLCANS